jgi:predicted CXXCH cytochrome family protein
MSSPDHTYSMRTGGPDGRPADFAVSWVIGGKRMQDSLTAFPDGRWQVLPVYYHVTGGAWVDYTESKQGALGPDHPFYWTNFRRTANRECLDCHTTGLAVRYDRAASRFTTEFADPGVTCEACHGPGGRHAETQELADIVNPKKLPPGRELAVCAQCHGPRNPLFPLLDAAHRFRPGDAYDDHYQALVVVDGRQRSGDFFADGRPKTSSFEYQALAQSACLRRGQATCLSCHAAAHETERPDELRVAADDTCRPCHAGVVAAGTAHSHHRNVGCVACHMPSVVSGVLDHFADHALDVPNPTVTARHGVPNACNACHAHEKERPEATAAALARLWPTAAARQARRRRLADAIDETTRAASRAPLLAVLADREEAPTLRGAAAVLLGQRFPADAVATLVPLLQDPDALVRVRAVEGLGFAHARGAVTPLARLASADPALAVRHYATLTLFDLGETARAEQAAKRLAADPASEGLPQPHVLLALAAGRRRDLTLARRELERALVLIPYDADNLVLYADLLVAAGQRAEARAALNEALRFAPRHAGAAGRLHALEP